MKDSGPRFPARSVAAATLTTSMVSIPVYLLGGLSVLVREELAFSEQALGLSGSSYFLASFLSTLVGGRVAERWGGRRGAIVGVSLSAGALISASLLAQSWLQFTVCMALAGIGHGFGHPSSNWMLARGVPRRRQGVAFGVKQSAMPLAGLIVGAALPFLAVTLGWRWTFFIFSAGAIPILLIAPPDRPDRSNRPRRHPPRTRSRGAARGADSPTRILILLSVAGSFGSMGAASLVTYFVESHVAAGISLASAGALLALGNVATAAVRLGTGLSFDRRGSGALTMVRALLIAGSVGFALLGAAHLGPLVVVLATILAFGLGWGWNGLFFMAVVRLNPTAPGMASAIAMMGAAGGGVLGPVVFGTVVAHSSYPIAWATMSALAVLAAFLMQVGQKQIQQWQRTQGGGPQPPTVN